jgi:hypothetical protein
LSSLIPGGTVLQRSQFVLGPETRVCDLVHGDAAAEIFEGALLVFGGKDHGVDPQGRVVKRAGDAAPVEDP